MASQFILRIEDLYFVRVLGFDSKAKLIMPSLDDTRLKFEPNWSGNLLKW